MQVAWEAQRALWHIRLPKAQWAQASARAGASAGEDTRRGREVALSPLSAQPQAWAGSPKPKAQGKAPNSVGQVRASHIVCTDCVYLSKCCKVSSPSGLQRCLVGRGM